LTLVKSSDYFVEAVARIAKYLGVSEFVIGLTVIAIGTSLPELGSSLMASFSGETELAVGAIMGSNIANIGLILGLSSVIVILKTNKRIFLRDALILFSITMLLYYFCLDGSLSFFEGLALFSLVPIYLAYLFKLNPHIRKSLYNMGGYLSESFDHIWRPGKYRKKYSKKKDSYEDFVWQGFDLEEYRKVSARVSRFKKAILKDFGIAILAGVMIYISARFLIPIAVDMATLFGVTQNVIGATLIAVGTSLPELSVSVSSIRKGFGNMLLGNMIGSNIFNMTLVGGLSAMVNPLEIAPSTLAVSLPMVTIVTGLLFIFIRTSWKIKRYEGAALFMIYSYFIFYMLSTG
jgi:cation:H+ antiporter